MPLNPAALTDSPGIPGAGGRDCPETLADCAKAWADAMAAYVESIVPPSTTVAAAAATLETALIAAFQTPAAAPLMETAFTAFATSVGGGMVAAGFTGVPPATPVGFAALFILPPPQTREEGVARVAQKIDTWMRTGTAALIAPPNTVTPWA